MTIHLFLKNRAIDCASFFILLLSFILFFAVFLIIAVISFPILLFSKLKYVQKPIPIEKLQPGDIVMTGTNKNLSSFVIKMANILTNGMKSKFWTHIAIHVKDGELIEAQTKGIQKNTIQNYLNNGNVVRVFRHKYLKDSVFFDEVVQYCQKTLTQNCKYDFRGTFFYMLSILLPDIFDWVFDNHYIDKVLNLNNSYFCSELVAEAYEISGEKISQYDSWRIKPSDFMWNPLFVEITQEDS